MIDLKTKNAPPGSLHPVVMPMDCYVGIKPCGCMVAWVYDSKDHPKDVAKSVAQFIKDGYRVESANTDDIRSKLGPCKCKLPNAPGQRPGDTKI
jgi:hypothetical protein